MKETSQPQAGGTPSTMYRLCPQHSAENQRKIAAFAAARPAATAEDWEKFFEKNVAWQVRVQLEHCGESNGPHLL